jgi:hypothetical protein
MFQKTVTPKFRVLEETGPNSGRRHGMRTSSEQHICLAPFEILEAATHSQKKNLLGNNLKRIQPFLCFGSKAIEDRQPYPPLQHRYTTFCRLSGTTQRQ